RLMYDWKGNGREWMEKRVEQSVGQWIEQWVGQRQEVCRLSLATRVSHFGHLVHSALRMGKGAWWTALVVLLALLAVMGRGSAVAKEYGIGGYDIHLELTPEGSYIITERITFHFIEGEFTKANRRVPGRGFDSLRFISLEGVGVPVETQRVRDGRNLQVDWTY